MHRLTYSEFPPPQKKGKVPRKFWPEYLTDDITHGLLKGIFLGGCVSRGVGSSFRAGGHAHTRPEHPPLGWICFRAPRRLNEIGLVLHELAHVVTGEGHKDLFRQRCAELAAKVGIPVSEVCRPKMARPRKRTPETARYFDLLAAFKLLDREWDEARDRGEPEKNIIKRLRPRWRAAKKALYDERVRLALNSVTEV